jgi:hypothetical protein
METSHTLSVYDFSQIWEKSKVSYQHCVERRHYAFEFLHGTRRLDLQNGTGKISSTIGHYLKNYSTNIDVIHVTDVSISGLI